MCSLMLGDVVPGGQSDGGADAPGLSDGGAGVRSWASQDLSCKCGDDRLLGREHTGTHLFSSPAQHPFPLLFGTRPIFLLDTRLLPPSIRMFLVGELDLHLQFQE